MIDLVVLAVVCDALDSCGSFHEGGYVKYRSHSTGQD